MFSELSWSLKEDACSRQQRMLKKMPLPRFQLFELEDLPWLPSAIRDLATDYLHFIEERFHLHKPVVSLLRRGLEKSTLACVVDLCSGGGGPVLALYEDLSRRASPCSSR